MANVLGKLFSDIAKAIRNKTGESEEVKMKPTEFPEKIGEIITGASNVCVSSGFFEIPEGVGSTYTVTHNLGVTPDIAIILAYDDPVINNNTTHASMGGILCSKKLVEFIYKKQGTVPLGFIYAKNKSYEDYIWKMELSSAETHMDYDEMLSNSNFLGPFIRAMSGFSEITETTFTLGEENYPIAAGRKFFYTLYGNVV